MSDVMIKNTHNDMAKTKTLRAWLVSNSLQLTLQVVGLLVVIANLFIVSKLAPLTQDIAVITNRIEAIEKEQEDFVPRSELDGRLEDIRTRLIRMETLLDGHVVGR